MAYSTLVSRYPSGNTHFLSALGLSLQSHYQVVVVGDPDAPDTREMLSELQKQFLTNKTVLFKHEKNKEALDRLVPFVSAMTAIDHKATAYVCRDFTCNLPTTEIKEMLANLNGKV